MKKRGFALLLAVALCVGLVSFSALAQTEEVAEEGTEETITPEAEPTPAEEPAWEAEPDPGTEPEPEAEPESEPGPESEPEAEPETETGSEPAPAFAEGKRSGVLPKMAGTGKDSFPTEEINNLRVTWKDSLDRTVYSWNNKRNDNSDQSVIDGLSSGDYEVRVRFQESGMPPRLYDGVTYTLQLDWPAGDDVTVRVKGKNSGTYPQDDKDKPLFSWEVSDTGLLSITIENREDSFYGELYFTASVKKTGGAYPDGDPNPEPVSVKKVGALDEAVRDEIIWTVTIVVPRCEDKESPAWSLVDEMTQSTGQYGQLENDLSAVKVALVSTEYPAGQVIPSVQEAGADDEFAYDLGKNDSPNPTLYFLNRCTCEEGHCADWSGGCGTRRGDSGFCSCWHYIYNATFTLTYTTDIAAVLQKAEDTEVSLNMNVYNNAWLYKDENREEADMYTVYIHRPFVKKETLSPDDTDGLGQFEITFDPYEEDYSWAESITITDEMDNLGLVPDSLIVKAGDAVLTRINEDDALKLSPKTDRDQYYSVSLAEVTGGEGKKTGETLTITIWYPTDQVCTAVYDAAVLSFAEEMEGTYSNTVKIGQVYYTLTGSYREGHAGEEGAGHTYAMTLTKVDADDPEITLPGAVFEIYRYARDEGYEEDWLLATETTGEDGTFTFHSDIPRGVILEEDVLYYLREVQAPDGYRLTDTSYGFIFEAEGYTGSLPDGLDPDRIISGVSDENGLIHIALTRENQKESRITRAVAGAKIWEDQDNADGIRPESITVHLLADGVEADSRIVTAEDDWAWSFTGLDFYNGDGQAIRYTITEDPVEGYEVLYHDEDYDVTNIHTPTEKGVDTRGDGVFENDGEDVHPGDTVTYQIRFYNYKDEEAYVTVTDPLDEALDFVSASNDGVYEEETRTIAWTMGPVPARTWGEVTFTAMVNDLAYQEDEVKNTALVQIGPDQALQTNTVKNPVPEAEEGQPETPGKNGGGVKTGDAGPLGLWLALLAAGAAAAGAVLFRRRKIR